MFLIVWVTIGAFLAIIGLRGGNEVIMGIGAVMCLMTCLFN